MKKIGVFCIICVLLSCQNKTKDVDLTQNKNVHNDVIAEKFFSEAMKLSKDVYKPRTKNDTNDLILANLKLDSAISISMKSKFYVSKSSNNVKLGLYKNSYQCVHSAIKIDSTNSGLWFKAGLISYLIGYSDYEKRFKKSIDYSVNDPTSIYNPFYYEINTTYAYFMIDSVLGIKKYNDVKKKYYFKDISIFSLDLETCSKMELVKMLLLNETPKPLD